MSSVEIARYDDLLALLTRDRVPHQADPEGRSAAIPTARGPLTGVLVLRWQEEQGVLPFIQTLPVTVPPDRVSAVESALARLNHALILPGFGINHEARTLYYRVLMPLFPGRPPRDEDVRTMFRAVVKTAADFLPALRRVALEEGNPETVVADARVDLAMGESG